MKPPGRGTPFTRRDTLKLSGLALGGLAVGGAAEPQGRGRGQCEVGDCYPTSYKTDAYTYARELPEFDPLTPLDDDEMRISFMGSSIPPNSRKQELMSIFVQVGKGGGGADQAILDCGSGVCSNYNAMGIAWGQMDKVFVSHLHGDHVSDLSFIYQSGPQASRKSPLFVFGPGPSNWAWKDPDGVEHLVYDDGTKAFCEMFRAMLRWQSEGFCFANTGLREFPTPLEIREAWGLPALPEPVKDPRARWVPRYNDPDYLDAFNDGYAVVPVELKYDEIGGIAYHNGQTGLKITHFPVVHTRRGSIGYKLEWNGLSMVYTSDTKPERNCIEQAKNPDPGTGKPRGVDVFIHEMVVPAEVWAMKMAGLSEPGSMDDPDWARQVTFTKTIQDSSHTPQGAFGYILSQISKRPRLTVATHFPATDDTVACALKSVQAHVPDIGRLGEQIAWSFDLMVLRVYKDRILQHRAAVNDYSIQVHDKILDPEDLTTPKYWKYADATRQSKVPDPKAQIDETCAIPPGDDTYRGDGY